jgi:hypothetical protein
LGLRAIAICSGLRKKDWHCEMSMALRSNALTIFDISRAPHSLAAASKRDGGDTT